MRFFFPSYHYLSAPVYAKIQDRFSNNEFSYIAHDELSTRKVNENYQIPTANIIRRNSRISSDSNKMCHVFDAIHFFFWFCFLVKKKKPKAIYSVGGMLHFSLMVIAAKFMKTPVIVIQPCLLDYKNKNDSISVLGRTVSSISRILFGVSLSNNRLLFGTNSTDNYILLWDRIFANIYKREQNYTRVIDPGFSRSLSVKNEKKYRILFCFESFSEFDKRYSIEERESYFNLVKRLYLKQHPLIDWRTHPRVPSDEQFLLTLLNQKRLDLNNNLPLNFNSYTHIVSVNSTMTIRALENNLVAVNLIISPSQPHIIIAGKSDVINVELNGFFDCIAEIC
jgi:hypothetical protein